MSSNATITAKTGAGVSVTALAISDVKSFGFDCQQSACYVETLDGKVRWFAGYTTITVTLSSGSYTLTLS